MLPISQCSDHSQGTPSESCLPFWWVSINDNPWSADVASPMYHEIVVMSKSPTGNPQHSLAVWSPNFNISVH